MRMKKKSTKKVTKKSLKTLKAKRASKVKRKKYVTEIRNCRRVVIPVVKTE